MSRTPASKPGAGPGESSDTATGTSSTAGTGGATDTGTATSDTGTATSTSPVRRRTLVLGAATVDAAALGLYLASAGLFLAEVVGLSPARVGLVLGLGGAASLAGAVPIARLSERHDAARVLAGLFLARGGAFAAFALARDPITATIVVTAAGFLNRGIGPIIQALALEGVSGAAPQAGQKAGQETGQEPRPEAEQVATLARIRALRNAGIGLGGIPVGFVLAADSTTGFRVMLLVAGVLAGAAVVLALRLPASEAHSRSTHPPRPPMRAGFVMLTITYGVMTLSGIVMGLGLPLLIVQEPRIPHWTVGVIQVGNTVLVVALQVLFSRGSQQVTRARAMLCTAGGVNAVGCLLMLTLTRSGGLLAAALVGGCVLVFTFAELLASSGGAGLMLTFVPDGQRARYLAVFNLGFGAATIVGPPLVGVAVTHHAWGWPLLAMLFLLAAAVAWKLPTGNARTPQPT